MGSDRAGAAKEGVFSMIYAKRDNLDRYLGLCPALDTVLLPARPEHLHISSTMVREMLRHRQSLAGRMPPAAVEALQRIREGKVR